MDVAKLVQLTTQTTPEASRKMAAVLQVSPSTAMRDCGWRQ